MRKKEREERSEMWRIKKESREKKQRSSEKMVPLIKRQLKTNRRKDIEEWVKKVIEIKEIKISQRVKNIMRL